MSICVRGFRDGQESSEHFNMWVDERAASTHNTTKNKLVVLVATACDLRIISLISCTVCQMSALCRILCLLQHQTLTGVEIRAGG